MTENLFYPIFRKALLVISISLILDATGDVAKARRSLQAQATATEEYRTEP